MFPVSNDLFDGEIGLSSMHSFLAVVVWGLALLFAVRSKRPCCTHDTAVHRFGFCLHGVVIAHGIWGWSVLISRFA